MTRNLGKLFGHLLAAALFVGATLILYRELQGYHYEEVARSFSHIPRGRVALAIFLTFASYLILSGYDYLALRYIGRRLPYRRTALASFVAYALSHSLGFSALTGSAARYRFFSLWGLSAGEIARSVSFSVVAFWLGFSGICGAVLAIDPVTLPSKVVTHWVPLRLVGFVLLGLALGFALVSILRTERLTVFGYPLEVPRAKLTLRVIGLGVVDWLVAAAVLFVLLPHQAISFPHFLGIFLVAQIIGVISHVPGGLGLFEAVMFAVLGKSVPGSSLAAILLAYRLIYYLAPLLLSTILFLLYEILSRSPLLAGVIKPLSVQLSALVPRFLTLAVFVAGAVLVISGASPPIHGRFAWIATLLPLSIIEVSHFIASVSGIGLILLARGLQQRLDFAWVCSCALLVLGAVASLFKGLDFEESAVLGTMFILLFLSRSHFYRRASLFKDALEPEWVVAILSVLAAVVGLVFFSFKHVEYSHYLWWEVGLDSHAPRTLRAMLAVFALAAVWGGSWLLKPHRPGPMIPESDELDAASQVMLHFPKTFATLALTGDKSLLFNPNRSAFLMYGVEGSSFVALGGPVGPVQERPALIWEFLERCDLHHASPAFYQAQPDDLPTYVDAGLHLIKLGQEGVVPLPGFTLEGQAVKSLRQGRNRIIRDGYVMEVVPPQQTGAFIAQLRAVSDDWLRAKNTREKGFSLGYFSEPYLQHFPIAVVRQDSEVVAFANVLSGAEQFEISVDLMRYSSHVPSGVMDFLFIELMLWGKERGFRQFNLGMAPLAGFENHELSQLWNKVGNILFQHGEHFYNFQGVRAYKEKFHPVWEPRYLASQGGLRLPIILANVATLISRGVRGLLTK
ncbi:MAG: bifunctional lysylphosphatidylglycerol flippase/synthetase MprF [Proteobacteria bacterium]|nr:bifunctional lysylphosphatidylglycerol flippase/synthetase MprF [Pseudomonadota bacterium]